MHDYYLSLGSNISPEKNLMDAVRLLSNFGDVVAASKVYETPPVGDVIQENYLNAAVLVRSTLSPNKFQQQVIQGIEQDLKRVRTSNKFGPRTIDIDIILFDQEVIQIEHRQIPSDEILERDFVAIPMAEISPNYTHPVTGQKLHEIARSFRSRAASTLSPRPDVKLL
jgi:2-amino-4-hydroxy-6-hydroxymethyldihydropteridine diphosphokinase